LTISPFVALVSLLAWGQLANDGTPGGLLIYNESGEVTVQQRAAPEFEGIDFTTGNLVSNANLRGNIVMLDFWSSWCVACRAEAADLAAVYLEYAGMPVEFVGLAIWDETGDALRHIDRFGVTYPNIMDSRGTTAVTFGVRGVPEKFFLDEEGNILRKINGPVSQEKLREIIDSLLES
jgi:cytochrome c biogenesis protein CcmG/thiol:disulfide interchange protein DsbE